jgi:hypothetical protein
LVLFRPIVKHHTIFDILAQLKGKYKNRFPREKIELLASYAEQMGKRLRITKGPQDCPEANCYLTPPMILRPSSSSAR